MLNEHMLTPCYIKHIQLSGELLAYPTVIYHLTNEQALLGHKGREGVNFTERSSF